MADNFENRTLNGKLISEGFNVEESIPNKKLPEYLTKIMIEFAQGKYNDVRIVPSDIALDNSEWQLKEPSHIVYVKDNPNHPNYKQKSVRLVMPLFVHRKTGEYNTILPIASIR